MLPTDSGFYETAPVRFDNSVAVPVSASTVWRILEDDRSWTVWAGVIDKVEWTSPKPFGLGTTRTVTMVKGLMIGWETFIAWEPGKRMGFCFTEATIQSPHHELELSALPETPVVVCARTAGQNGLIRGDHETPTHDVVKAGAELHACGVSGGEREGERIAHSNAISTNVR